MDDRILEELNIDELKIDEQQTIYNNGSYVRIEEDQMLAWLYLANTDIPYTKEEIYTFLQDHGVVKGYHTSNIAAMAKKHVYEREIKIAEGKSNKNGKDGYFDYTFTPELFKLPKVQEDGSVDYTNMTSLQNVKEGDIVAIYHPAVQGEDGYSVTGIELKAFPARELPPIHGHGVVIDESTGYYMAAIDGKVEILGDRVDIRNVHEVKGDVDQIIGKIDFIGDVIIWGNVEAGVQIKAARNIQVHGSVEAADLIAGGDIILSRGIQGGQKAKIKAEGNIFADFIEHTDIEAKGNVQANSIINSNISADGKVVLTGKRGLIIGGYTHGLQGIDSKNIGNDVEVRTIVHAGYRTEDQKQFFALKKAETAEQQHLSDILEELATLQRNQMMGSGAPNPVLEKRVTELKQEKDACHSRLMTIRKGKEQVEHIMELGKEAKIVVDGNIHRGVIICIDTIQVPIEHNTCYMRYFSMGGKMESNVIIK